MLEHVDENKEKFGTVPRIKGMVTMAKEVSLLVFCRSSFATDPLSRSSPFRNSSHPSTSTLVRSRVSFDALALL